MTFNAQPDPAPLYTAGIQISGKDLGEMARENFCERCFWLKRTSDESMPFQSFPGIFSAIDSLTKNVMHRLINDVCMNGRERPEWLRELEAHAGSEVAGYVAKPGGYKTFRLQNAEYNILLTGVPDDVLILENRETVIVDYKTARFTGHQNDMGPQYVIQLNSYAMIADALPRAVIPGKVSAIALVYFEPQTTSVEAFGKSTEKGFSMDLNAKVVPLKLEPARVTDLFPKLRKLYDLPQAPDGCPGCPGCVAVDALVRRTQIVSGTPQGIDGNLPPPPVQ